MPDLFDKVSFDGTCIPEYVSSLNPKFSASADFTMEATINGDLFAALCGVDMARGKDFTVEFDKPVSVQVRYHRKKRINKKWAKRYGCKTIFERYRVLDATVKCHEKMLSIDGLRLLKI